MQRNNLKIEEDRTTDVISKHFVLCFSLESFKFGCVNMKCYHKMFFQFLFCIIIAVIDLKNNQNQRSRTCEMDTGYLPMQSSQGPSVGVVIVRLHFQTALVAKAVQRHPGRLHVLSR
ncbi:unnamed protein product, partial [Vitis vinifera]